MTTVYCGNSTALTTTKWGAKIYVDTLDTSLAPHLMIDGDWEPWVTNCMAQLLLDSKLRGCTFIDVGANVGWYTLLACGLGAKRVYAFEPNPRMASLLRRTLSVNGYQKKVTFTEAACGEHEGKLHLFVDPYQAGGAHIGPTATEAAPSYRNGAQAPLVEVVRLDEVVLKEGLEGPVIMKIDVEGFEPRVIAGASRLLTELKPILFIEHHEHNEAMLAHLTELGYQLFHVQHTGHLSQALTIDETSKLEDAETLLCRPVST